MVYFLSFSNTYLNISQTSKKLRAITAHTDYPIVSLWVISRLSPLHPLPYACIQTYITGIASSIVVATSGAMYHTSGNDSMKDDLVASIQAYILLCLIYSFRMCQMNYFNFWHPSC